MANYVKGNVVFTPVVEQINRKWCIRAKKCAQPKFVGPAVTATNSWMGSGTRTKYRAGLGSMSKNYFMFRENARSSAYSGTERAAQQLFAKVSRGTQHCLHDMMQLNGIQQTWAEAIADLSKTINGVTASGYTFVGWVFAVQHNGAVENPQYDVNTFPTQFDA